MVEADYIVVGSGLTGAVIARLLADAHREVVVVERRSHVGGNVHDHSHPSGIRIHTYGPHYFRTSSDEVWDFATRFGSFFRYEACLLTEVDGTYENWPLHSDAITRRAGKAWSPAFVGTPRNFEEAALSIMPLTIYRDFVKEYNEKQWGVPAATLAAELCTRFDVRHDGDARLKPGAKHQGIPEHGYAEWTRTMLQGIPVVVNCDFKLARESFRARKLLIYTGAIDEYFNHEFGHLKYRGQVRTHQYLPDVVGFSQPSGQVNAPTHRSGPHIRTLEWKHMMPRAYAERITGTVLTTETPHTPSNPNDFEYPFPDDENRHRYARYRAMADATPGVVICGRLGEYRYVDMDQAIARAQVLARRILER
jgi:UDP-galactopyranose mutase